MKWTKGDWENLHTTNNFTIGIGFAADQVEVLPEMKIPKEPNLNSLTTEMPMKNPIKYLLFAGLFGASIWVVVVIARIAIS